MKKCISLLLACALAVVCLTGCQSAKFVKLEEDTELTGELRVYFYQTDPGQNPFYGDVFGNFDQANPELDLQKTVFHDAQQMMDTLVKDQTEGTLPDVLLFHEYDCLDLAKLAKDGFLMDLSGYLADDQTYQDGDYYKAVMTAGQFERKLYYLPFTFHTPVFWSSQEKMRETGLTQQLAECADSSAMYQCVLRFLQEQPSTPDSYSFYMLSGGMDLLGRMNNAGYPMIEKDTYRVLQYDQPEVQQAVDLEIQMYHILKRAYDEEYYSRSMTAIMQDTLLLYSAIGLSAKELQEYDAMYKIGGETMTVFGLPLMDDRDGYGATVNSCGAVTAEAKNPLAGYAFLRYMMDCKRLYPFGFSINRTQTLEAISKNDRPYVDELLSILDNVTAANLYAPQGARDAAAAVFFRGDYEIGSSHFNEYIRQFEDAVEFYLENGVAPQSDNAV